MKQSILGFLFCLFCSAGFCQQSTVIQNEKDSKYSKEVVRKNDMSNGFSVKQRSNDTQSSITTDKERKVKASSSTNNSLRMQSTSTVTEEANKERKSADKDVRGTSRKGSKLSVPKR